MDVNALKVVETGKVLNQELVSLSQCFHSDGVGKAVRTEREGEWAAIGAQAFDKRKSVKS